MMACEEHKLLSHYIKDVHLTLRKLSLKLGPTKAWHEHCQNTDVLTRYARYMEILASTHWEDNCASESNAATSRIKWAADLCCDYFLKEDYIRFRQKDKDISERNNIIINSEEIFSEPLKLIDVGSCYNPFKIYDIFDVWAVDLCPANNSVYQCDFLNVPVGLNNVIENAKVLELQESYFDIVTFCFLLEYIPSSDLRICACEKAYNILKPGGLLIINTPDSKHVGANCKIMKCWRYSLALIGLTRIKYEKFRHMHCMAFRKSLHKNIAVRWATLHKESYMQYAINIPQDFQEYTEDGKNLEAIIDPDSFKELPFHNILEN